MARLSDRIEGLHQDISDELVRVRDEHLGKIILDVNPILLGKKEDDDLDQGTAARLRCIGQHAQDASAAIASVLQRLANVDLSDNRNE